MLASSDNWDRVAVIFNFNALVDTAYKTRSATLPPLDFDFDSDNLFEESPLLAACYNASAQNRVLSVAARDKTPLASATTLIPKIINQRLRAAVSSTRIWTASTFMPGSIYPPTTESS